MSAAWVELDADILHARLKEVVVCLLNTLAALADRIHVAGHEVNGHILVHGSEVFLVRNELNTRHHITEQAA